MGVQQEKESTKNAFNMQRIKVTIMLRFHGLVIMVLVIKFVLEFLMKQSIYIERSLRVSATGNVLKTKE